MYIIRHKAEPVLNDVEGWPRADRFWGTFFRAKLCPEHKDLGSFVICTTDFDSNAIVYGSIACGSDDRTGENATAPDMDKLALIAMQVAAALRALFCNKYVCWFFANCSHFQALHDTTRNDTRRTKQQIQTLCFGSVTEAACWFPRGSLLASFGLLL